MRDRRDGRTQQRSLAELLCEPVEPLLEARSEPAVVVPLLDDSLRDLQRLVILDDDPLRVPPTSIGSIRVLETIKEGTTVFRLEPTPVQ